MCRRGRELTLGDEDECKGNSIEGERREIDGKERGVGQESNKLVRCAVGSRNGS